MKENNRNSNIENEVHKVSKITGFIRLLGLIASGVLLVFAFPPWNISWLAWIGLVPFYLLIKDLKWNKALIAGYIWGYAWSVASCFWLREVDLLSGVTDPTAIFWLTVARYCMPFAIAIILGGFYVPWALMVPIARKYILIPIDTQLEGYNGVETFYREHNFYISECFLILFLASFWTFMEWVRTWLYTGFPWNLMAVSQWKQIPIIQVSSITGVYGVSFIIVLFNIALAHFIIRYYYVLKHPAVKKGRRSVSLYFSIIIIVISLIFGYKQIIKFRKESELRNVQLKAAVVEGNIPQIRFPEEGEDYHALEVYMKYSREILNFSPDILIWPEGATPRPIRSGGGFSEKFRSEITSLINKHNIPILLGTIDFDFSKQYESYFDVPIYNSALLIEPKGNIKNETKLQPYNQIGENAFITEQYNKIHLVPWGEYTPFAEIFPWVYRAFNMGRSLTPGTESTIFNIKDDIRATVLICYEDIYPDVARAHILNDSNLLILITNDAWFMNTSEPEQHLAQAIFRTVENGRTMIRVGNCAGTCVIDPIGFVSDSLFFKKDKKTGKFVPDLARKGEGTAVFDVRIQENPELTFYTKYGNVFILLCGFISIITWLWIFGKWMTKKRKLLHITTQ